MLPGYFCWNDAGGTCIPLPPLYFGALFFNLFCGVLHYGLCAATLVAIASSGWLGVHSRYARCSFAPPYAHRVAPISRHNFATVRNDKCITVQCHDR